jgi:hypothetical protein
MVEMNNSTQAIMPEEFLKYLRPKIPSTRNPVRGRRGIKRRIDLCS